MNHLAREINNCDNIIDSRDVIKRIEELESDRDGANQDYKDRKAEIVEVKAELNDPDDPPTPERREELLDKIRDIKLAIKANREQAADKRGTIYYTDDFFDTDAYEELVALKTLTDQGEGYGDWDHGETLISDDYFETYAEELAEDLGYTKRDVSWPFSHINWERAADELKQDYTSVDFDGVTYWMRR